MTLPAEFGAVAIGRNEGKRLHHCLGSLFSATAIVYVDSGSSDGSTQWARNHGVEVVELDLTMPFTAARARNAGFRRLQEIARGVHFVQFVDGDCVINESWPETALTLLKTHPSVAAVVGRLRERDPTRSVYNWLCEREWDGPTGEVRMCGGIAMVRARALQSIGGFRDDLMAGEEPELCIRLRAKGWRIWRLEAEMALHDAAMTRFSQWWRRASRAGYAFAQGAHLHGAPPERHWVWESRRAWLWGVWLPLACLSCGVLLSPWGWAAWLIYPLQVLRQTGRNPGSLSERATSCALPGAGPLARGLGADRIPARPPAGPQCSTDRIQVTGPMRVAYLINQYPKTSHTFIRREIQALERQSVEVMRIALRGWDGPLVDAEDEMERNLTRYVLREGAFVLLLAVLRMLLTRPARLMPALGLAWRMSRGAERPLPVHLAYLAEACRIVPWLRAAGIEHVHAHFGTNSAEVAMLVHALGGPRWSFTVHGPEEFDKAPLIGLGEKLRRAAFVVAISSYGRSQLYRQVAHAHWSKVKVVPCGLEPAFSAAPARPPPAARRLVCVGRLTEQKGQLLLVEAARRLAERGADFELVLAGDGEMRADVEALIARASLGAKVRITGWISSGAVREKILAARALVLASFAEGLPVVIMEAMALRRPVISTYVAGIPELVLPGEHGWLVPAGDAEALADAMQACLDAPVDNLARMGEAAHARVRARHDVDKAAEGLAWLFGGGSDDSA